MAARPHILVVDHSLELLEFFQELLTEEGYCVTPCAQLEDGIDMVAKINPDLLVIEYRWEAMDEIWLSLRQLRTHQLTRHVPIILCTSLVAEVGRFQKTLHDLNVRVVLKPFEIDRLLGEIAAALAG